MARRAKPKKRAPAASKVSRSVSDKIVLRDPAELTPFPNNPKIHTAEQIEAIAALIDEFGFDQPAVIDEHDTVLKGHGRRLACIKRGYQIPTITSAGLSIDDKIAIVLSDNQVPLMTGFDDALLRVNLTTLAKHDYPLQLTGFSNIHLATFIGGGTAAKNQATLDNLPELAPAISRAGDVWHMGSHRLVCGDCTDAATIEKLWGRGKPRLMLTDPPYRADTEGGGIYPQKVPHAQQMKRDQVHDFEVADLCELLDTNVIFTSKGLLADYLDLARERKLTWDVAVLHREAAVPNHNNHLMSDLDYVVMMGKIAPRRGLEHEEYSKYFGIGHWERPVPWAKPVELMARLLRLFSDGGDSVFEPYCGSGTTLIAAEQLQRVCLAVELNPAFVDMTVRRWEKVTGKRATLAGGKKTFEVIERERSRLAA